MPADNSATLTAAAARRSHNTRQRARSALQRMDSAGTPVTFASVAEAANVSRSWLYRQPDIRAEIDRLRAAPGRAPVPAAQRASSPSLQQRIETLLATNRGLREENRRLRDQTAALLGEQRATHTTKPSRSRSVGPCS